VKGLSICAAKRHSLVPELPTKLEAGAGYVAGTWGAVFAPVGTPRPIIERLAAATREALARAGGDAEYASPEERAAILQAEIALWGTVVREANITAG
jgi:tripartite-type tricarboxylate transporter receptor subunit TctC